MGAVYRAEQPALEREVVVKVLSAQGQANPSLIQRFRREARAAVRLCSPTALLGLLWTVLIIWLWTAQGYIAGIPLDALTWLAFGLAVTTLPPRETAT